MIWGPGYIRPIASTKNLYRRAPIKESAIQSLPKEARIIDRAVRWLGQARPVEISSTFFILFFLSLNLLFFNRIPSSQLLLVKYIGLLLLIVVARRTAERIEKKGWVLFRDFLPILLIFEVYDGLGYMLHVINPADADSSLIRIDRLLFGVDPSVWLERFASPLLNDLMHLAYFSFYFLPILLGIIFWVKGKRGAFNRLVLGATGAFYLCYLGYILVPAVGPRFTLAPLYRLPLEGTAITDFVRGVVATAENLQWDCFPSGHTAVTLVVLWYAFREERTTSYLFLPISALLLLSTLYCRYHYGIDLIAGAAVAAVSVWSADWLEYLSVKRRERSRRRVEAPMSTVPLSPGEGR
jgi:membrane-associated phospholipid phosphatase